MDFSIPQGIAEELKTFKMFLDTSLIPHLSRWYAEGIVPRGFFQDMGRDGWFGFEVRGDLFLEHSALKRALQLETLAKVSPGVAVAVLAHSDLGVKGLSRFGSSSLKQNLLKSAVQGQTLICLGNTELGAGSDVASVATEVNKVEGGWILNGTKAYVTNGLLSDFAVITAVSDPEAPRNKRLSLFMVDLASTGVSRKKLNKQVWIPSDLTRIQLKEVFVSEKNLLGGRGRGLQQVLEIFSHSRIFISALTLGTAAGAFELALDHAKKRRIFGKRVVDFQAKSFEFADFFARLEAARLMVWKACAAKDQGKDFRLESSMAKYLTVMMAQEISRWAADMFGAASVVLEHPIHKYPMDAWASSLGEGTQDVQKLVIFREIMKADAVS
jgi:alkylation response protein AidB-like acyl-CoA dehydrogenase